MKLQDILKALRPQEAWQRLELAPACGNPLQAMQPQGQSLLAEKPQDMTRECPAVEIDGMKPQRQSVVR